jgi:hypothetical protein
MAPLEFNGSVTGSKGEIGLAVKADVAVPVESEAQPQPA